MLSDEKLTELRSKYGLLPLMDLLRAVAEAAVRAEREGATPFCYASVNKHGDVTRTVKRADNWCQTPLFKHPPQPAIPAGPETDPRYLHLLDMLGAKDHEDAARIIAGHHVRELGAAPAGMALVPVEATEAMQCAGAAETAANDSELLAVIQFYASCKYERGSGANTDPTCSRERSAWDAIYERLSCYTLSPQASATVPEAWRPLLEAVVREIPREGRHGNAPGHGHAVPGIWDSDNGELAGKPCAWCLAWNTAKAMLAATSRPGVEPSAHQVVVENVAAFNGDIPMPGDGEAQR